MQRQSALALVFVAVAGCTGLECTLLPCFSGLSILLDRAPDPGTLIGVAVTGDAPLTIDCDVEMCWPRLHLDGVFSEEVSVSVTSSAGMNSADYSLNYTTTEPNGAGCGVCTSAEIHLTVP
jgi:hypothetical protein